MTGPASSLAALRESFAQVKQRGLALDMSRGKPSPEQLDLSNPLLGILSEKDFKSPSGVDCRNYGELNGLTEARALFASVLDLAPESVIVGGNSSLALMYETLAGAMLYGLPDGRGPWAREVGVKVLCPSPGYDRHFAICERLGIEMVPVPLQDDGPAMDEVERLAGEDSSVRGIWCVPRYSNPTGIVYSPSVVERLARMKTAASDFRIFWDNAYAVHHLHPDPEPLANIFDACVKAGNPNRPLIFGSTSKITFAGAGVSFLGASKVNLTAAQKNWTVQTIGYDKLNQLRHLRFLKSPQGIAELMEKHAALLRPRFQAVEEVLTAELGTTGLATWSKPRGGYFVSLDVPDGCAKRVVALAAEAGVKLTPAGNPFPYGRDPRDRNIRLAPSFPALDEIRSAMQVIALCVRLAAAEKAAAAEAATA